VNSSGHVLTNHHVVEECPSVYVTSSGKRREAALIATDERNDLAVIKTSEGGGHSATFRKRQAVKQGEAVWAIGYPLHGLLSSSTKVTSGTISALAGLGNDSRMMQISAPVQPGNSGGPLLGSAGHVVGVVTSKIDAIALADFTGDIPQNVNFAIKASVIRAFLDSTGVEYSTSSSGEAKDSSDIARDASRFTVLIECVR